MTYQHLPLGHLLGTPGERERDGRQQRLGNERDGHADGEHEPVLRPVAQQEGDAEEGHADADGDGRDHPHHVLQTCGERRRGLGGGRGEAGDAGQPGGASGGADLGDAGALHHERSGEQGVTRLGGLRPALTGEVRRVHQQPPRLHDHAVGRHPVARLDQHHVADDHLVGLHHHRSAITAHRHPRRQHAPQALRCAVRPGLLEEREEGVEDHHDGDRHSQRHHPGDQRQPRSTPQHEGEEVDQLAAEAEDRRAATGLGQPVRAVAAQTCGGLSRRQPGGGPGGRWNVLHTRSVAPPARAGSGPKVSR